MEPDRKEPLARRAGSAETNPVELPKWSTKEIPCPDCYGGHFRPCNICGDSGVALLLVESPNATGSPTGREVQR